MTKRDQILQIIRDVPALPTVAVEVQKLLSDKDMDFRKLVEKIKYDPGLTANILSLANSAYFGFSRPVNSLSDAVVLMGTKRIYELIIAESLAPLVHKSVKGYDLPAGKLWEHSVAVAVGCEELTRMLHISAPDYIFTAGLLHNVGKIVLGTFVEIEADPILELARKSDMSFDEAEKSILGIDHAEAGAILLESWKLPEHFINAAQYHHRPDENPSDDHLIVDLVHTADVLTMMSGLGTGTDELNYRADQKVIDRLGVTPKLAEKIIANVLTGMESLSHLLLKQ